MKMKHTLITIFLTLVATTTWAQEQQQDTTTVKKEKKEKKLYLWGFISDSFTKAYVPDVKVVVLRADSSLVDSAEQRLWQFQDDGILSAGTCQACEVHHQGYAS